MRPTPGRLETTLRIVLSTVLTLILLMTWRIPTAAIGLYLVFMVARDSPAVSLRAGILMLLTLAVAVGGVLFVVGLTDNDPMARVLSVAAVGFLAGMVMRATTLPNLGTAFGFIFCFLIANWEFHRPSEALVRGSLWLIAAGAVAIGCSVAIEYCFGVTDPVKRLDQQLRMRYKALERMFGLMANGVESEELSAATLDVTRIAAAGQAGMQELYASIVDRNLEPKPLPIGSRVHITMLAQLMDVSAAFGSQHPNIGDPSTAERCGRIAANCHELGRPNLAVAQTQTEQAPVSPLTLLDRVEFVVHTLTRMPQGPLFAGGDDLIALPSKKVPILVSGGFRSQNNLVFALKLSLCATACYVFNHAVAWPGISTSVATVFLTALSTTGAIKQKLLFRLLGSLVGGLALGIGASVFVFPQMDSITALVVLVAVVAFLAAWCASGRYFGYIGLQIALSFYFVAFEGFSAPTELAPARDRFVGILVGLAAMWFVFDQMWPVRTVAVMRREFASVLRNGARLLQLGIGAQLKTEEVRQANALRDQIGKTVSGLRSLNDAAEFEFGVELDQQRRSSHAILRAAFSGVAMFWIQLVVLTSRDEGSLRDSDLLGIRRACARELNVMANAVERRVTYLPVQDADLPDPATLDNSRYGEYARNVVNRFVELQREVHNLNAEV